MTTHTPTLEHLMAWLAVERDAARTRMALSEHTTDAAAARIHYDAAVEAYRAAASAYIRRAR